MEVKRNTIYITAVAAIILIHLYTYQSYLRTSPTVLESSCSNLNAENQEVIMNSIPVLSANSSAITIPQQSPTEPTCSLPLWTSDYIATYPEVIVEADLPFATIEWGLPHMKSNVVGSNCTGVLSVRLESSQDWVVVNNTPHSFAGDHIVARCTYNTTSRDNLFIRPPTIVNRRPEKSHSSESLFDNIVLILLDAVSRPHFKDEFPSSWDFISNLETQSQNKYKVFDFKHHTTVGHNSPENKLPMFGGSYFTSPLRNDTEWIWDYVEAMDYESLHVDGQCGGKANKDDWKDYYDQTLIGYYGATRGKLPSRYLMPSSAFCLSRDVGLQKSCKTMIGPETYETVKDRSPFCLAHRPSWDYQFDYISQFIKRTRLKKKRFVMVNIYETHEPGLRRSSLDSSLKEFLREMFGISGDPSGQLSKKSAVFLISDHGSHYGTEYETFQGFVHHKRPLNVLITSTNVNSNHPQYTHTLLENTNRLTSHFDFYLTLKDFILGRSATTESSYTGGVDLNSSQPNMPALKAYSFLDSIPQNRTCEMAGIPSAYCPCGFTMCDPQTTLSTMLENFNYVNNKIREENLESICPLLILDDAILDLCFTKNVTGSSVPFIEVRLKSKKYGKMKFVNSKPAASILVNYYRDGVFGICQGKVRKTNSTVNIKHLPCFCE